MPATGAGEPSGARRASWRLPRSIVAALEQLDVMHPLRGRSADGTIGDAAHAARESDHNPDARGYVHAFDITHDPKHGVDCNQLARHLVQRQDARVRYVIWHGRIVMGRWSDNVRAHRAAPWVWHPYHGVDPHTGHMHVSIGYGDLPERDVSPWWR